MAQLAFSPPAPPVASAERPSPSFDELLPALVRSIAWCGDAQRGSVRVELGAGELAGGMLLVQAEDGRVRVHLRAPPGADTRRWRARIAERLEARGLAVDGVEVE
jgi:hypothetical protein